MAYAATLLVIVAAGTTYTQNARNVPLKRIVWPITVTAMAGLFLGLFWLVEHGAPPDKRLPGWPIALIIVVSLFFTYRGVGFCSNCGATSRGIGFRDLRFCSRCGKELGK
jgi:hypothetical protein